jgi:pimeloyl-ACP methyl ester carboxylesterase
MHRIPWLPLDFSGPKERLEEQGRLVALLNGKYMWANYYGSDAKDAKSVLMVPDTPGGRLGPRPSVSWLRENKIRLIIPDPPGVGHSDRQPGQTLADAARDLLAVADRFGMKRFGVIGLGTGGPIALKLADLARDRVSCVSVVDGPHQDMRMGSHPALMDVLHMDMYGPDASLRDQTIARVAEIIMADPSNTLDNLYAMDRPGAVALSSHPSVRSQYVAAMEAGVSEGPQGWQDRARMICGGDWGIDWVGLPPVRFAHGGQDYRFPLQQALANAAMVPGAQLRVVLDANQFDMVSTLAEEILWTAGERPAAVVADAGETVADEDDLTEVVAGLSRHLLDVGWPLLDGATVWHPLRFLVRQAHRRGAAVRVSAQLLSADVVRVLVDSGQTPLSVWGHDSLRWVTASCSGYGQEGPGQFWFEVRRDPAEWWRSGVDGYDSPQQAIARADVLIDGMTTGWDARQRNWLRGVVAPLLAAQVQGWRTRLPSLWWRETDGQDEHLIAVKPIGPDPARPTLIFRTPTGEPPYRPSVELQTRFGSDEVVPTWIVPQLVRRALKPLADQRLASLAADAAERVLEGVSTALTANLTVQVSDEPDGGRVARVEIDISGWAARLLITETVAGEPTVHVACVSQHYTLPSVLGSLVALTATGSQDIGRDAYDWIGRRIALLPETPRWVRVSVDGTAFAPNQPVHVRVWGDAREVRGSLDGSADPQGELDVDVSAAMWPARVGVNTDAVAGGDTPYREKEAVVARLRREHGIYCLGWEDERVCAAELASLEAAVRSWLSDAHGRVAEPSGLEAVFGPRIGRDDGGVPNLRFIEIAGRGERGSPLFCDYVVHEGESGSDYGCLRVAREILQPQRAVVTAPRRLSAFDYAAIQEFTEATYLVNWPSGSDRPRPSRRLLEHTVRLACEKLPDYRGLVFRRVGLQPEELGRYREGQTITLPGVASALPRLAGSSGLNVELRIWSETGKDITAYSTFPDRPEVVFAPGTEFRVDSRIQIEPGRWIINLVELPSAEREVQPVPDTAEIEGERLWLEIQRRTVFDRIQRELLASPDRKQRRLAVVSVDETPEEAAERFRRAVETYRADDLLAMDIVEYQRRCVEIALADERAAKRIRGDLAAPAASGQADSSRRVGEHDCVPRLALLVNAFYHARRRVGARRRAMQVPDVVIDESGTELAAVSWLIGGHAEDLGVPRRALRKVRGYLRARPGRGVILEELNADGRTGHAYFVVNDRGRVRVFDPSVPAVPVSWREFRRAASNRSVGSYRTVFLDEHGDPTDPFGARPDAPRGPPRRRPTRSRAVLHGHHDDGEPDGHGGAES